MAMNRRQFLRVCGGTGFSIGASGIFLPQIASALNSEKTARKPYMDLKAEDLRSKLMDVRGSFCDWYFNVTFEHKGLPYVLIGAIVAPGFSGQNEVTVAGVRGPFKMRREKALDFIDAEGGIVKDKADKTRATGEWISVLEEPEWHFRQVFIKQGQVFKQEMKEDTITVQVDNTRAICSKNEFKLRLDEKEYKINLDCVSRGSVIWWGGEPNKEFNLTQNSILNGFEIPCDIEGTAMIRGEKIKIKGRGIFEHVWIKKLDMMELRSVDWIILNFDQSYVFLFKNESITQEDRCLRDSHTGAIYLDKDKKVLPFTGIQIRYRDWAYAPKAYRFIPISYEVIAETKDGLFKANMEPVASPAWYVHRRMETLSMDNIGGWNFSYWDALLKAKGTFTYKDGKVLNLTNGVGINEPQRVSPLT